MNPDLRIDWDVVCANPSDFEKLVKLLLQRLHQGGEVIDGNGGDGGREFQVRTLEDLIFNEAKSFTGRINRSRRAQIERSLTSAAKRKPTVWHLVVPIDHNPAELAWFDGLRAAPYPFIGQWHGQTWLEEQLARHPDLVRYAVQNKLLEYVRQYKIETEALTGGTRDLIDRYDALDRLGDELSPDWRPVVSRSPDGTQVVALQAKHADAAKSSPIGIKFAVSIPDEPETADLRERIRANALFGTSVDIPGQYLHSYSLTAPPELGLSSPEAVLARVIITEIPETENLPRVQLAVQEPNSTFPLVTLPFRARTRTRGTGARLTAYEAGGVIELIIDASPDGTSKIRLNGGNDGPILPSVLLPGLRLLRALREPNILVLTVQLGGTTARQEMPVTPEPGAVLPPDDMIEFVEDIATIQEALRHPFSVPEAATAGDVARTRRLSRLLQGAAVPWTKRPVTITLDPDHVGEFKELFPSQGSQVRISWDDLEATIAGEVLHTGPAFMIGSVTAEMEEIPDDADPDREVTATLTLISDSSWVAYRGIPDDEPDQTASPSSAPPGAARVAYRPHLVTGSTAGVVDQQPEPTS